MYDCTDISFRPKGYFDFLFDPSLDEFQTVLLRHHCLLQCKSPSSVSMCSQISSNILYMACTSQGDNTNLPIMTWIVLTHINGWFNGRSRRGKEGIEIKDEPTYWIQVGGRELPRCFLSYHKGNCTHLVTNVINFYCATDSTFQPESSLLYTFESCSVEPAWLTKQQKELEIS